MQYAHPSSSSPQYGSVATCRLWTASGGLFFYGFIYLETEHGHNGPREHGHNRFRIPAKLFVNSRSLKWLKPKRHLLSNLTSKRS